MRSIAWMVIMSCLAYKKRWFCFQKWAHDMYDMYDILYNAFRVCVYTFLRIGSPLESADILSCNIIHSEWTCQIIRIENRISVDLSESYCPPEKRNNCWPNNFRKSWEDRNNLLMKSCNNSGYRIPFRDSQSWYSIATVHFFLSATVVTFWPLGLFVQYILLFCNAVNPSNHRMILSAAAMFYGFIYL